MEPTLPEITYRLSLTKMTEPSRIAFTLLSCWYVTIGRVMKLLNAVEMPVIVVDMDPKRPIDDTILNSYL